MENEKTIGEKRMRVDLDVAPGAGSYRIKQLTAELINECEKLKAPIATGEQIRLIALAQTHYETAAMFAVKAATA